MNKRILLVVSLLIVCLLGLSACGGGNNDTPASPGGSDTSTSVGLISYADGERVVNFAYQAITESFNVPNQRGSAEGMSYAQVYDTLLVKNMDGDLLPSLAKTWQISDDGIEYTFQLEQGVKWHDGEEFTAEDVVYSYQLLTASPSYSWIYENIERMEILSDYELKIYLKSPNATFLSYLAVPSFGCIMAKHALEQYGDAYGTTVDSIVGTGPYIVTAWQNNVAITYTANPDYFKGVADIKDIVFHQITDTNAAIVALQTGELDLYIMPVSGTAYDTLSASPNVTLDEYASARNEGVYMYCKDGLFADVRMRQAVAYAINKEDALIVGADGMGQVINYPGDIGPTGMTANPDYTPKITYEHDLEKARELVRESGNEGAKVVVKSYNTDPYGVLATYLQNVLSQIGLDASVEPMERATFLAEVDSEQVDILPLSWNGQTYDIDEVLGGSLHSSNAGTSANYGYYIDAEMDALIEEARALPDLEARKEIYRQIIDKFMEEVPFVSLYAVRSAIPHSVEIQTDNPRTYRLYDYTWVK